LNFNVSSSQFPSRAKLQAEISKLNDKLHTLEQQKSDNDGKNNVKVAELAREFREKENDLMAQVIFLDNCSSSQNFPS